MKYLLQLLFFLGSITCYSQNYLTNAQVYDFQPGDAIQWFQRQYPHSNPTSPTYRHYLKDSIISRQNFGTDSVVFEIIKEHISIPPFPTPFQPTTVTYDTVIFVVKDLNDTAYHPNVTTTNPACFILKDTVQISNYFGFKVWNKVPEAIQPWPTECFEPNRDLTSLYERIGGPEAHTDLAMEHIDKVLHYFKLATGETYGNLVTSTRELPKTYKVNLFPNPVNHLLTFQGSWSNEIRIMDITGKVLLNIQNADGTIDVQNLSSGIYFIRFEEEGIVMKFYKL